MKLIPNLTQRTNEEEIMDDFKMEGKLLEKTLDQLSWINNWLGGNQINWTGVKIIQQKLKQAEIVMADLGCGGGDGIRFLAKKTRRSKPLFRFIGMDANLATLSYAKKHSAKFSNISYQQVNILDKQFQLKGIDVVTLSLFLHHFRREEIISLIRLCKSAGVKFILINDLQRHNLPYFLFSLLSRMLFFTKMARHDGLISIRKGFTKQDLVQLMEASEISSYLLKRKWAWRYLVLADLQK